MKKSRGIDVVKVENKPDVGLCIMAQKINKDIIPCVLKFMVDLGFSVRRYQVSSVRKEYCFFTDECEIPSNFLTVQVMGDEAAIIGKLKSEYAEKFINEFC